MEIIHVKSSQMPHSGPEFKKWIARAHALIGYKGNEYLFYGSEGDKDFCWMDGELYSRDLGSKEELFTRIDEFISEQWKEGRVVDIVCECGNKAFFLNYSSYSIKATCPQCEKSQVVLEG